MALAASTNLNFVHEVSVKGGGFLTAHQWDPLEDRQQRRHSAVNFLALTQHTARGQARELRHQIVHYNGGGAALTSNDNASPENSNHVIKSRLGQ